MNVNSANPIPSLQSQIEFLVDEGMIVLDDPENSLERQVEFHLNEGNLVDTGE